MNVQRWAQDAGGVRKCIRKLFAHLQTDSNTTLHAAVEADSQTLMRPSKVVNCA